MRLLVKNIAKIVGIDTARRERVCGADMAHTGSLDGAWLAVSDARIEAFGEQETMPDEATFD